METGCYDRSVNARDIKVEHASWFVDADEFCEGDPGYWQIGEEPLFRRGIVRILPMMLGI